MVRYHTILGGTADIDVDDFFIHHHHLVGTVSLHHLPSELQAIDLLTKPRTRAQHSHLISKLMVYDPP